MNNAYTSLGTIFGPLLAGILFEVRFDLPYLFGGFVLLVSSIFTGSRLRDINSPQRG